MDAWRALGEDPELIIEEIKSNLSIDSRINVVESILNRAERIGKALMAVHHPDKNQNDSGATKRFIRVKNAIESIRFHTEIFKKDNIKRKQKVHLDEVIFK